MEQVFSYIISLGASVMMPIIFTVIGLCIGMKFGKALKSGLFVGVGFVGLGVVTALLTTNFNDPLKAISDIYHLQLNVFDMGWPAAAAVAYNTAVGALIIPICLGVNFLMLITKTTRTVNIDLWNYWHFAFIGAVAYFVMGESLLWGYFAAIVCYMITLVCADLTADKFQKYYDLDGISIPQPFCQSFMPFAIVFNKLLDMIPGFSKLDVDAEGLKKKFGVLGEPLVLGVIVGALIGWAAQLDIKKILFLGVTMGAVMELIPRITSLFIDGLKPISEKTQELVKTKFNGKKVHIGMSPALVIGHPTTLVVSVILIPVILAIAVFLPGNQFLPLASLAGMFYLFPLILPFTKGNVVKTLIIGLVALIIGLYFVTDMAPDFTMAANQVYAATGDNAAHIPDGFAGGALDFASSLFGWVIYRGVKLSYVGMGVLTIITIALLVLNRQRIVKEEKAAAVAPAPQGAIPEGTVIGDGHIKYVLARIDSRLLHGQVATAWTKTTQPNRIIVVSDGVAHDDLRKDMIIQAAPPGVKAHVVPIDKMIQVAKDPRFGATKAMLLFETPQDALRAIKGGVDIKELNLGSMAHSQGKVVCTKAVSMEIMIDVRKVLTNSPENFDEILKKVKSELKMA